MRRRIRLFFRRPLVLAMTLAMMLALVMTPTLTAVGEGAEQGNLPERAADGRAAGSEQANLPDQAADGTEAGSGTEQGGLFEGVMAEMMASAGEKDLQSWVDHGLSETAEGNGGWALIALRQRGEVLDYSGPRRALEEKAAAEKSGSVTKRLRMAMTLRALESDSPFLRETAERAAAEQTLMPVIFRMHLANNGVEAEGAGREEILSRLLELQLEDGGWAVIGTAADPDCTAMALQALAPLYGKDERATAAADRGLAALAALQEAEGGFWGMGAQNAESCAQVLLALTDLGIDPEKDPRFIKNGNSVLSAMMRFHLPEGGFSHEPGGEKNDTATLQAFYALAGLERFRTGGGPFFLFGPLPETGGGFRPERVPLRTWLLALAGLGTAAALIGAAIRKKRNWRSYAFPLLAGGAAMLLIGTVSIQSPEGYYAGKPRGETNLKTVISIRCDTVAGESPHAPADGVILAEEKIPMAEGESAFDQLLEATRMHRIQMEFDGTTAGTYVRGIGYLYEFAFGDLSGWMYKVNGVYADVGCSQYRLRDGDRVEWVYTKTLGKEE